LGWNIVSETGTTRTVVDTFQKGFFQFSIDAPNRYLVQTYQGNSYQTPLYLSYLLLTCIGLVLILGSVAISYTKGIWYYLALLILGIFIYYLHLEVLLVFGWSNLYWPILVFLTYGITIHLFHDFWPDTAPLLRYAVLTCLTLVFFIATLTQAKVGNPLLHLTAYGWAAPFGLALVYIFLVSTEIYSVFLFVATDSKHAKPTSSLINFLLMSLIYLGNIILTFLKNRNSIDWEIIYLEAPFLLVTCAVLGIWGNKKKEPTYRFIADFSPATALWHLALAINCFVCYAYVNQTGSDSLQEVMEDTVIFSQIATGVLYILFIVANFWGFMTHQLPIHMVVYQPKYMPFGFVRITSLLGIMSMIFYNNYYQYRQALGGYYSNIAEVYLKEGNLLLANEYLTNSLGEDIGSHKSNYTMAMMLHGIRKGDIMAKSFLKQATYKNPFPQTYASLGSYFVSEGDVIRAIETLREGKTKFPHSPEILNNLALAFAQTDIVDSTLYYLKEARKNTKDLPVAATNELAFALKNNIPLSLENTLVQEDLAYEANYLAMLNKKKEKSTFSFDQKILKDTALSEEQLAFVLNLAYNSTHDSTKFKTEWLDTLAKREGNTPYYEDLTLAKAFCQYYGGKVADGIVTMDQLQATGSQKVTYAVTLSNWLMQQDAPRVAMDFLSKARAAGDIQTSFGMAIATSFYLPRKEALDYWSDPIVRSDSTFRKISSQLQSNQLSLYTLGILPQSVSNTALATSFFEKSPSSNDKNKALGRWMNYLNSQGEASLVTKLYTENDKTQQSEWEYLRALRKTSNASEASSFAMKVSLPQGTYVRAWSLERTDPKEATKLYCQALTSAPLYEEGILDAISFLESKIPPEEMYNWLLQSVMLNQYSAPIQKAYARQCVKMNLFGFADYSVGKLKDLVPASEHLAFSNEITKLKEEVTNKMDWK
jgi:tetratricopeptide (TPR) repeat protein